MSLPLLNSLVILWVIRINLPLTHTHLAFLTVERMATAVQSLEQLSRQSRIAYTVVEKSDVHQYFKNMKHAEDKLFELWKQTTLNASSDEAIYRWMNWSSFFSCHFLVWHSLSLNTHTHYRTWDYPLKEQYSSILMSIERGTKTLPNASEGFRRVNEREDFAFIHDVLEIKYEMARNCNFTTVGDTFAEQPYAIGKPTYIFIGNLFNIFFSAVQQGSLLQVRP